MSTEHSSPVTVDLLTAEIRKIRRQLGGFDYATCEVHLAERLLAGILAPAQCAPGASLDPPAKWLDEALRYLARELLADPKTPWIGERDPKLHICWTAADRLQDYERRLSETPR